MSKKVIAVIPAYNAGDNLINLADQLKQQTFDDVYILNDVSTDTSIEAIRESHPSYIVIDGEKNVGPAGNRNRILDVISDELIVFIDADMVLEPGDMRRHVEDVMRNERIGMAGGYILNKQHYPMGWNYGFEMNPKKDAWFSQVCNVIGRQDITDVYRADLLDQLKQANADYHWVYPALLSLQARHVDWVAEGLFTIHGDVFKRINGYDEAMTYHEGQDLARRVRDQALEVVFDPNFSAVHQERQVRSERRASDFTESQFYFFQKHWGMSRDVFDHLYL